MLKRYSFLIMLLACLFALTVCSEKPTEPNKLPHKIVLPLDSVVTWHGISFSFKGVDDSQGGAVVAYFYRSQLYFLIFNTGPVIEKRIMPTDYVLKNVGWDEDVFTGEIDYPTPGYEGEK